MGLFQLNCTSLSHVINTICFPIPVTNQQSYNWAVGSRTDRKGGDGAFLVFYTRQREVGSDEK